MKPDFYKDGKFWDIPKIKDYEQACKLGNEYFNQYALYMRSNPRLIGSNMIMLSVKDMQLNSPNTGVEVGFLSELERRLFLKS
jgi:hypothetical protein